MFVPECKVLWIPMLFLYASFAVHLIHMYACLFLYSDGEGHSYVCNLLSTLNPGDQPYCLWTKHPLGVSNGGYEV